MEIFLTADSNAESGVGPVIDELSSPIGKQFATKAYGNGLAGIVIVLMCRNPDLQFKQRIRFSKKKKTLYMDIMLDLKQMIQLSPPERRNIVLDRLADDVPAILKKYSLPDFDEKGFINDLTSWLSQARDTIS